MARFIPIDKMKKLREAAKNGDERAIKIISTQLDGKDDFSSLIDDYFNPKQEAPQVVETDNGLDESNGLKLGGIEHLEHHEHGEEEEHDVLTRLMKEELDAIRSYSEAILKVMDCDKYSDNEKRGIISRLEEIKRDETEHYEELKRLKENSIKKEEKEQGIIEQ